MFLWLTSFSGYDIMVLKIGGDKLPEKSEVVGGCVFMYILLELLVILISIFNIFIAIKRKTKKFAILNGAFYFVIVLVLILDNVNNAIITNDSENYSIYYGGILSSVRYERTEGDYHIIKRTGILLDDEIAVPANNTDISFFSKIYKPVQIYCNKGTDLYGSEITISSKKYKLCNTVVKIKPDFFHLIFSIGFIDFLGLIIFNLVLFITNIVALNKEK